MSLKPTAHQKSIIEEKIREVLSDPGYSEADKAAMRELLRSLKHV